MKKIIYSAIFGLTGAIMVDCSDSYLERPPQGVLSETSLASEKGVNAILISAYSNLDGWTESWGAGSPWPQAGTNWIFGDVAGGDAYKGSDPGDQAQIVPIEKHQGLPSNNYFDAKWLILYNGVARSNATINLMAKVPEISDENRTIITAQARFLRGHFHFEAKKMWNMVPYIDDAIALAAGSNPDAFKVPNTTDIWPQIEADIQFAIDNLPATMSEVGRVNKSAAQAYMAKVYMFQHKFNLAEPLLDAVIASGVTADGKKYGLNACFHDNFKAETKNSQEAVFSIQASVNDGNTDGQNGNWGDILNNPYTGGPGTCCGFHQPSQNLVNAFHTNAVTGLPLATFNSSDAFITDQGIPGTGKWDATTKKYEKDAFVTAYLPAEPNTERVYKCIEKNGTEYVGAKDPLTEPTYWNEVWREDALVTLDPRLDYTIGRRGLPYLDWGNHPGASWIRDQSYAGPYSPIKRVYYQKEAKTNSTSTGWAQGPNANNYTLIRFADVLLWRAEIAADEGQLDVALGLVNQIRNRAKTGCTVKDGAVNAANYKIELYPTFADKATAVNAVRFERRLELAEEGHRFFDLVRWGIADTYMNTYFTTEGTKRQYLQGSVFTPGKNEYFPLPQGQIINSSINSAPTLTQNPGY